MKVAFVAPRYGEEIVGGAEAAMRRIAERLHSQLGWEVEAYSSCAADYMRWDNDLPAGETTLNGVRVHRYRNLMGRTVEFDVLSDRLLRDPTRATRPESDRWIDLQGPFCPDLLDGLATCDADVVSFSPYLYYPVVRGIEVVARRSIFHPAAHDEPPIYLPAYRDTFLAAAGFVFNAGWERQFVQQMFGVSGRPQLTLGLGVEDPVEVVRPLDEQDGELAALSGTPYLCCLGRVDAGKGTSALAEMFAAYKERHPGPLKLVFVGPVVIAPPEHPDIVLAGQVDEETKWALLDGALSFVSPSSYESLSIVVLEAWARRLPVIVNGQCAATREQSELSRAGIPYYDYDGFAEAVTMLAGSAEMRAELGRRGLEYIDRNFRWPALIERWGRFAEGIAARA